MSEQVEKVDAHQVRPTSPALVALAWAAVGIPLAYGLWQTILKAITLFSS